MRKLLFFIFLLCAWQHTYSTIYYVRVTGLTANDGLSWANATSLHQALALAAAGDTILVAKGTYKPDTLGTNRNLSFVLKDNIVLVGGYADTGNPTFGSANGTTNPTILSGDLNNNDACATMATGGSTATYTDNSYHVIRIPASATTGVLIRYFTISGGAANAAAPNNKGGGILVANGAGRVRLRDCTISCNFASSDGAGIAHESGTNSRLWLQNCTITQNRSNTADGGGIMVQADSLNMTDCTLTENRASSGGALSVKMANPASCVYSLLNNRLENNTASLIGGAISLSNGGNTGYIIDGNIFLTNTAPNGGAIGCNVGATSIVTYIQANKFMGNTATSQGGGAIFISGVSFDANGTASSTILNNVFSGNKATGIGNNGNGGAITIQGLTAAQNAPVIVNNTFSRNTSAATNANRGGGALFISNNANTSFTVYNNIFWNNTANAAGNGNNFLVVNSPNFKYAYSIINAAEGSCSGTCQDAGVLINKDPKFYDDDGADNTAGTLDDDLRLQYDNTTGVTINNGFDTGVYAYNGFTTLNIDFLMLDRTCLPDIGAYEYTHYWKGGTTDWNTGANWSDKCGNVVPTAKMNVYIGTNDQSTTNANGGITGTAVSTTPNLTTTNHVGFSLYVNNDVTMQASTLITLQGHLRSGGSARFNNLAATFGGRVLMKPSDCSFAQQITHGSSQMNFYYLEIDNAANVAKSGRNVNVKMAAVMTNGNLSVSGGFTLLSDATTTAMVANDPAGTTTNRRITGTVTAQRHVTGHPQGFTGVGYHYFSSPFANSTISQFNSVISPRVYADYYWFNYSYTDIATFPNIFFYKEGNNSDNGTNTGGFEGGADAAGLGGWRCPAGTGSTMGIGIGYAVHIQQGLTASFSGTLNNGTLNITVSKTGAAAFSGWNLVGNPYPSPLDWDMVQAANSGVVEAAIYRRIPKGSLNVVTWSKYVAGVGSTVEGGTVGGLAADVPTNVNKDIALGQGFFVVAKTNGNIQVTNAMRPIVATQTQPLFLRKEKTESNDKMLGKVHFRFQNTQYYDDALVYFKEKATENYDGDFDAYKGTPNGGTMPDVSMTTADNKRVSINGLPKEAMKKSVAITLHAKTAGEYTFKAIELKNFEVGTNVILWDKKANIKQNLVLNPTYKFTANAGVEANRFELLFDTPLTANEQGLTVFPNPVIDDKTTLQIASNELNDLAVKVYDVMGRVVLQETYKKADRTVTIALKTNYLQAGTYVVEVNDGKQTFVSKLVK
jgi:hypothetical protein